MYDVATPKHSLTSRPHGLHILRMGCRNRIDEMTRVVYNGMSIIPPSLRLNAKVCPPLVAVNRCLGTNKLANEGH